MTTGRQLVARAGALAGAAVAAHVAPVLLTLRRPRMLLTPGLAGIGEAGHVALTFDDGPDPVATPAIMDALDRLGWKATFFLLGDMVRACPSLPAELVAAGHEVAVHGETHRSHMWLLLPDAVADVRRGRDIVAEAAGVSPRWFRPPFGTLSAPALVAGRAAGLETVLWTSWGRDWRAKATPASVADTVLRQLTPGATILLHDSDCTSAPGSWRTTAAALPLLAEHLHERGLQVGPLCDHRVSGRRSPR